MCGIVGWLGQKIEKQITRKMSHRLMHRGPDDSGEWYSGDVWLGHQRLAILDLTSDGRQPMISASNRLVLTYNGEVYNYLEIRSELEQLGMKFRGNSDSEVVLTACDYWGIEKAVNKFEGMFSIALYDKRKKLLWLVRDRMGIKPLYYTNNGRDFAFSSELSALQPLPWLDDSINVNSLYAYFRYSSIPAPESILSRVHKLASGTILCWDGQNVKLSRYWDLETHAHASRVSPVKFNFNQATEELNRLLVCSIRQQMRSDVPYGAFLSGGIDSSLIVALMQSQVSRPIKTFTVGFKEKTHDESKYANAVAKFVGSDHYEVTMDALDVPDLVTEVSSKYDEPFADSSSVPTYFLSRFAREHVKVCLSGDGGDELFGGYPRYFWGNRIERLRTKLSPRGARFASQFLQTVPNSIWDQVINPITGGRYAGNEGLSPRIKRFADYLGCSREAVYINSMSAWRNPEILINGFCSEKLGADAASHPDLTWAEEMMLIDQTNHLQDDLLVKIDRASMAVSLEVRVPFLRHTLVEWSWKIPLQYKFNENGDQGKRILRELLYRYVDKKLIERPKQGLGMPMTRWLRGSLRDWAESLLVANDLDAAGLNASVVRSAWENHLAGNNRLAEIWTVLMYRQWQENWNQRRL